MGYFYIATTLVALAQVLSICLAGGWNDPSSSQYHIQTDEGPERYFRYQTDSGQYRKEKRLEDGTVIGTYAWIDDNGFLRQRDYIADNAGYRILKTKNVFVGRNVPVGQAVSAAKKLPASAGTLVKSGITTHAKVTPAAYIPPTPSVGYASFGQRYVPQIQVSPNSIPSSTESPLGVVLSTSVLPPYLSSPVPDVRVQSSTPPTVYIPSTTSRPFVESSTTGYVSTTNYHEEVFRSSTPTPSNRQTPVDVYLHQPPVSTLPPPINSNSLDFYSGAPQYEHYKKPINPYVYQNGPTYPIDRNGNTYNGYNSKIGNGYNAQYPYYDGVSVTNDGFRYYIPRAYHEEQNLPGDQKSGSFGYIDPFGIRRVIYYNAGPGTGFQHRKNNRYVGFDATPYDPRPV